MKIRKYSDTEEFRQKPTTPTHDETEQGWPNDGKPTLVYPVIIKELPAVDRNFQGYEEVKQYLIEKFDLGYLSTSFRWYASTYYVHGLSRMELSPKTGKI